MKFQKIFFCELILLGGISSIHGFPNLNLGYTAILDGGPLRPQPGLYFENYMQWYHSHNFLDSCGHNIGGVPSPNFNIALVIPQIVYQTDYKLLFKGNFGFQAFVPFSLYTSLQHNTINFATSGPGMGDLTAGVFLQWDPILLHGREFLVHRLEFDVFLPIGKNKEPQTNINIGNGVYVINPYWAGTLFLQPKISISWRAHYAWISKNKKSGVQYGNALHTNFDFSVEPYPKLWLGVCGYYLQQLKDNVHCGTPLSKSKGRTLGFGPGFLYFLPKDLEIFGYLYFEKKARNFSQGISFIVRLIKYF